MLERHRHSRRNFVAAVYALHYTLSFIASAVAPYFAGFVGDTYGLKTIFYVNGAVMLFALPLVIFLKGGSHSGNESR